MSSRKKSVWNLYRKECQDSWIDVDEAVQDLVDICGGFTFHTDPPTLWRIIRMLQAQGVLTSVIIFLILPFFSDDETLFVKIVGLVFCGLQIQILIQQNLLHYYKPGLNELLNWCRALQTQKTLNGEHEKIWKEIIGYYTGLMAKLLRFFIAIMQIAPLFVLFIVPLIIRSPGIPGHIPGLPYKESPWFEVTAFIQYLSIMNSCWLFCMGSGVFLVYMLHVLAQADFLSKIVENAFDGVEQENYNRKEMEDSIKMVVDRHCDLIGTVKKISKIFSIPTLLAEGICVVVICTFWSIFRIAHDKYALGIAINVCFFPPIVTGVLGDFMTEKIAYLARAAYFSKWYDLKARDQKLIVLIIGQANKRRYLTRGGLGNVSMERFADMITFSLKLCLLIEYFAHKHGL